MYPTEFNEVTDEFVRNKLFFLNIKEARVAHIFHLILQFGNGAIRSQGRIALPTEMWMIILDDLHEDAMREPDFVFVRVSALLPSPIADQKILRCIRHQFNFDSYNGGDHFGRFNYYHGHGQGVLAGQLANRVSVNVFHRFINKCTDDMAYVVNNGSHRVRNFTPPRVKFRESNAAIPDLTALSGPGNTFNAYIARRSAVRPSLGKFRSGFYSGVEVPDVIARAGRGVCWACKGHRYLYGGRDSDEIAHRFSISSTYGLDLPCPLCMGIDFATEHARFLKEVPRFRGDQSSFFYKAFERPIDPSLTQQEQDEERDKWYREAELTLRQEEIGRGQRFDERLQELGYGPWGDALELTHFGDEEWYPPVHDTVRV